MAMCDDDSLEWWRQWYARLRWQQWYARLRVEEATNAMTWARLRPVAIATGTGGVRWPDVRRGWGSMDGLMVFETKRHSI
ncbi:hypothetical protein L6452_38600 [Arctium lappa]|uniref:Uncharacterized protein n=1 Tax=Arctium lappa TaxID=4217 RepID=A0ACB8XQR6_ARCLA|nr:hypothetical protein L6452_38600 [Arctium lappa]